MEQFAMRKVVFATIVAMVMIAVGSHTHVAADLSCETVVNSLLPCKTYLKVGGTLPSACCDGVRSLKSAANTPALRRTACDCIKVAAQAYQVNANYAANVPTQCNVNIGYPISYNVDCTKVQ